MTDRQSPSRYFTTSSRAKRGTTSRLISVRLPEELIERLAAVGNEEGLAMSDTIRVVLERGLAKSKRSAAQKTAARSTAAPTTKSSSAKGSAKGRQAP